MDKNLSRNVGFSLVEMAVVVLIISFLILGVRSGFALLAQSKLRAVLAESDAFLASIKTFQVRFNALPGDFPGAYAIWGSKCGANALQCNGNGDNRIQYSSGTTNVESFHAWQHLSLAGLIQSTYSGIATVAGQADITKNIPGSALAPNAGWNFDYISPYSPPTGYGQYMQLGAFTAGGPATGAILSPDKAKALDTKADDGMPNSGFVMAVGTASSTGCFNNTTLSATYNSNLNTILCSLRFIFNT